MQLSQAAPGQPFAAPQALLAQAAARATEPGDEVQLAGDGSGGHILQWQVEQTIETALQATLAEPFVAASAPPPLSAGPGELRETLIDEAGETMTLLLTPSGIGEAPRGALAVFRRRPGGAAESFEYLVAPAAHVRVEDAQLALRPDGAAAVVWVEDATGPDGATVSRLMLALAPPGSPFGPAQAVTGLASSVEDAAVSFDAGGVLRLAWTTAREGPLPGELLLAAAQPGGPDPLSMPGPRVALRAQPRQAVSRGVNVSVHAAGPCLVLLEDVAPGRAGSSLSLLHPRTSASHYFAAAGTARLHIPEVDVLRGGGRPTLRLVAYASSPDGASSAVSISVAVRRGRTGGAL